MRQKYDVPVKKNSPEFSGKTKSTDTETIATCLTYYSKDLVSVVETDDSFSPDAHPEMTHEIHALNLLDAR